MTSTAKPTNMRVLQILLLITIVVGVKSQSFGTCTTNAGCPPEAKCIEDSDGNGDKCECNTGFYAYDTGVEVEGNPQTMCTRKYLSMHVQLSMLISYSSATILEKHILCLFFYYYKL